MDSLWSDGASAQVGSKAKEILRTLMIDDRASEPHNPNQNYAERSWRDVKRNVNATMNMTGAPANTWLLALQYVIYVMNRTSMQTLNWRTPYEKMWGVTPDISAMLEYHFYEPVYYKAVKPRFPKENVEEQGWFVGISENVGNAMTFLILTRNDTLIERSVTRSAAKPGSFQNLRANYDKMKESGKEDEEFIYSVMESQMEEGKQLPTFDPSGLVGRTYIEMPQDDGTQRRITIKDITPEYKSEVEVAKDIYRFKCRVGQEKFDEIMTYNQMRDHVEQSIMKEGFFEYLEITDFRPKLTKKGKPFKSPKWEVLLRWDDGSTTWEPLEAIADSDHAACALFASDKTYNGERLVDQPGWQRFKRLAGRKKKLYRLINQAKLKSNRARPMYQYGVKVP